VAVTSADAPLRLAVIETAPFGGLLHYAAQLADALAKAGDDVDLVVPAGNELESIGYAQGAAHLRAEFPRRENSADDQTTRAGLLVRRARTALWRVKVWVRIISLMRKERYDAVVLNGSIDLWLSAVGALCLVTLSGNTKVTHVCHNVRPFNRWGGSDLFVSSRLLNALLRVLYPAFDVVFVHGERSRAELEATWRGARAVVIPHGDEHIFGDRPPAPASEPRALFFGDWRKVKGLSVLMAAFDELVERMPEARLTIAGSPAHEEGEAELVLRWAAGHDGRVETIAGYVPVEDVAYVFGRARVVVLPYLVGYQSGVLHVAMTMGRAVIASDVGDLGTALGKHEAAGILVSPGEPEPLAQALRELLSDPARAERMGEAARRRAESASSWSSVATLVRTSLRGGSGPGG
jgi:glycosyltransferase involved in cell wall biosynthesis